MTLGNALLFINKGMKDEIFRKKINAASSMEEIEKILASENMVFEPFEFEDAFNKKHLECQEESDAEHLKEFKTWWDLVLQFI